MPTDPAERDTERLARRLGRNRAVLAVLILFVLLFYGIAMVRLG